MGHLDGDDSKTRTADQRAHHDFSEMRGFLTAWLPRGMGVFHGGWEHPTSVPESLFVYCLLREGERVRKSRERES